MVSHSRAKSKGSFSVFTLDTIRSLSRAGSRQATRIPSKDELRAGAESSLSYRCDPYNQPPASPAPTSPGPRKDESLPPNGLETLRAIQNTSTAPETQFEIPQRFNSIRRRAHRLRPKSWLPFAKPCQHTYPRSFSSQLPKTNSSSTVARSVISAPILTSTTNTAVAQTEGVHCGEVSDLAFGQSTCNLHIDRDANGQHGTSMAQNNNSGVSSRLDRIHPHPDPGLVKGRIVRLRNAIKSKIRTGSPLHQIKEIPTKHVDTANDSKQCEEPILERDLSRRRAETLNLYKNKVKGLTGSGHIRRRSINAAMNDTGTTDMPLLHNVLNGPVPNLNAEHSDGESPFGSLTKSFASAVEKLDFYSTSPRNASFIRSRSSFFNLKKNSNKDQVDPATPTKYFPPISPSQPAPPVSQGFAASSLPSQLAKPILAEKSTNVTMASQNIGQEKGIARWPAPPRPASGVRQSPPTPMVFSEQKNGYVASRPVADYPRGVNPLRMHPPDIFAEAPPGKAGRSTLHSPADRARSPALPSHYTVTPTSELDEESDAGSLEDAPIYSPSLGDLSQYARDTPRSKAPQSEARRSPVAALTPTRTSPNKTSRSGRGGILKKSRSGLSLFSRAKVASTASFPASNPPLQQRDVNQKIETGDRAVKKSKSLHFGTLFKKDDRPDLLPSNSPSPFQPATPSPLRKVMRYGSQSTKDSSPPAARTVKK